jgi:hypothetical protein
MTQPDVLFLFALLAVMSAAQCMSCNHAERSAIALERIARASETCAQLQQTTRRP